MGASFRLLTTVLVLVLAVVLFACREEAAPSPTATPSPAVTATPSPMPVASPCSDQALAEDALAALPGLAGAPGRIAYICEGQVWTMWPDGSDQRRLTGETEIDYDLVRLYRVPEDEPPSAEEVRDLKEQMNSWPRWLPDGRVVFASIRDTLVLSTTAEPGTRRPFVGASELYVVNPDGMGLDRLTDYNSAACDMPEFCFAGLLVLKPQAVSPEGDTVAVDVVQIKFSECCRFAALIDLGEGGLEKLSITPVEPEGGNALGFSWAPDGQRAALYHSRDAFLGAPDFEDLAVRELDTGEDTLLVRAGNGEDLFQLGIPAWSPVGDHIAFCGRGAYSEPFTVYVVEAAGGEPEALAELAPPEEEGAPPDCAPVWSPDGAYIAVDSGDGAVLIIDADSGAAARVVLGGQPSWGAGE